MAGSAHRRRRNGEDLRFIRVCRVRVEVHACDRRYDREPAATVLNRCVPPLEAIDSLHRRRYRCNDPLKIRHGSRL